MPRPATCRCFFYIQKIIGLVCLVTSTTSLFLLPNYRGSTTKCHYGGRGSLTAQCVYVTSSAYFKLAPYRFDYLDETLNCVNCSLGAISGSSFDINNNNIVNLNLRDSNIIFLSNSSFVGLIQLRILMLARNKIESLHAGIFYGIKKVTYLDISSNSLRILEGNCFAELGNLTELNLSHNVIANISSEAFNGLGVLEKLNLEGNDLRSLGNVFTSLPKLKFLNLRDNLLNELQPTELNISTLLDLDLSQNNLTKLVKYSFTTSQNLVNLNISSNKIWEIEAGAFKGLTSLEYLDLNYNNLLEVSGLVLLRLLKLRDLHLAYNRLSFFDISVFATLPELRYLNVSHNIIIGIAPGAVLKMYRLHSLDLSFNNIQYLDYKSLYNHAPKVVEMRLDFHKLPCFLVNEMLAYFANDTIMFTHEDNHTNLNKTCDTKLQKDSFNINTELNEIEKLSLASVPHTSGNVYMVYTLIILLLIAVCALGFAQYKMYSLYRMGNYSGITGANLITNTSFENRMSEQNEY